MKYVLLLLSFFFLSPVMAQEDDVPSYSEEGFQHWLKEFKDEALRQGISSSTLEDAFSTTTLDERVLELDRKQPESKFTIAEYLQRVITRKRIEDGRNRYAENEVLLKDIGKRYGVPPRFIVSLWGIETNYGAITGGFETIDALATLAYDG